MNNNRLANSYKLPNDVKWIKSFLLNHIDNMLDELKTKLVYKVEKDGSVTFPADVKVENKKEGTTISVTELYETLQTLSTEIANISGVGDLENIMSIMSDLKAYTQSLKSNVLGVTRDPSNSTTAINDNLVLSNGATIPSSTTSNGTIFGCGATFGLMGNSQIKCSVTDNGITYTATWTPPNVGFTTNDIFSISLLNGKAIKTGNNITGIKYASVQTNITLEATDDTTHAIIYKIEIVSDGGECVITGEGLRLKLHLSKASRFTRGAFETIPESSTGGGELSEVIKFPQESYPIHNSDKYISFSCGTIKYDSINQRVTTTEAHPKLIIDNEDRSFNITNMHEENYYSVIYFINSDACRTLLNAYVSNATQEQKTAFAEENGFVSSYEFWLSVENSGLIINPYPKDETNGITFEDDGLIKFGETGEIELKDSGVDVKFDGSTGAKITDDGIETRNVKLIPSDDGQTNIMTQTDDHIFSFNNDAEFRWKDEQNVEHSLRISELGDINNAIIKMLMNRIITLERANAFQRTNLTNNMSLFSGDAPGYTDTDIYNAFYSLTADKKQLHVDPESSTSP